MLPPYPKLVTDLSTITVNHPDNRKPESYVQHLLQLDVKDRRYQPDEYGTKCNFYVHDCLHVLGYPVAFMLARQYIDLWQLHGSPIQRMVMEDAIQNANLGCPTIFGLREPDKLHSHVGVVLPQTATTMLGDVLVANVGASNFYGKQLRYAVAASKLKQVQFFGAP